VKSQPTSCLKNGHPVLRSDWAVTKVEGAIIFVALPQGGGGGGGKNPLRTALMIAVMVVPSDRHRSTVDRLIDQRLARTYTTSWDISALRRKTVGERAQEGGQISHVLGAQPGRLAGL
jgi:hypothetical protein